MTVTAPVRTRCPADLVAAIRAATAQHADWQQTAELVAAELRGHLPRPEVLTEADRAGDPGEYRCHVLHVEPDGSFSVTAMVWQPGQGTPIHDHVTWCVFGVIQGAEYEELYSLSADGSHLTEVGRGQNSVGDVGGFALRVTFTGSVTAGRTWPSPSMSTAPTSPGWAAASGACTSCRSPRWPTAEGSDRSTCQARPATTG